MKEVEEFFEMAKAVRAIRAMRNGNESAVKVLLDLPVRALHAACDVLERQSETAARIKTISDRHNQTPGETITKMLRRAAREGDAEAKALIAAGLLSQPVL